MSIWNSRGRRRAVARKIAPYLGVVGGSVLFAVLMRCLWIAYTDHRILMPLRRARYVVLEQEPGFFWTAVGFYLLAAVCAPVGIVSLIDDIRFRIRHKKS